MKFNDVDDLINKLKYKDTVEATKEMTRCYTNARFKLSDSKFEESYVDGANDGGLDLIHKNDHCYYIFQSKFTATPKKISFNDIKREITKIFNTITNENPNRRAEWFINELKRNIIKQETVLMINFITTNRITDDVIKKTQELINANRIRHNFKATIDFIPIDKYSLDIAIYDEKHGYVPQTGRKTISIDKNKVIIDNDEETFINSIICKIKILDILKWFKNEYDIKSFLQKNVRGFIGGEQSSKTINFKIAKSYRDYPTYFWYKHNGIIIFTDSFRMEDNELIMINPQIVNGGQTVTTIFKEFDKNRVNNDAEVLIRVYRLSYEDTETYRKTIDIISALNSQNKVNPSDLRSNDQVQVIVDRFLNRFNYDYIRKREKGTRSTKNYIKMTDLAKIFLCCKKLRPDVSVTGNVEKMFEDENAYNSIFDKEELLKKLEINHIIIKYITAWAIYSNKNVIATRSELDQDFFKYSQYYFLADIYRKIWDWKLKNYKGDMETWVEFVDSAYFKNILREYSRPLVMIFRKLLPSDKEARNYFRTKEAVDKFNKKVGRFKVNQIANEQFKRFLKEINS